MSLEMLGGLRIFLHGVDQLGYLFIFGVIDLRSTRLLRGYLDGQLILISNWGTLY